MPSDEAGGPARTDELMTDDAPRIDIRLMQRWGLRVDGQRVDPPYDKCLALLVYLLFHPGRALRREYLAELLWPQSCNDPRVNLRRSLFELRKLLRDPSGRVLISDRAVIRLEPEGIDRVDVWRFEQVRREADHADDPDRWVRVLDAYDGELLPDFMLEDTLDFMLWLDGERMRLRDTASDAAGRATRILVEQGREGKAMEAVQRWLTLVPDDHEACQLALNLALQTGQTSLGRRLFRQHEQALRAELDLEPAPDIVALVQRLSQAEETGTPISTTETRGQTGPRYVKRWLTVVAATLDDLESQARPAELDMVRHKLTALLRGFGASADWMPTGEVIGYFGYPMASETQTRRALSACQAILAELPESTGLGASMGWSVSDQGRRADVRGQLLRTALELAREAGAGRLRVDHTLVAALPVRLARGIRFTPLSERACEIHPPITVGVSRTGSHHPPVPLVGRDVELRRLDEWWSSICAGGSGLAWIEGEAGIGKTRLATELVQRALSGDRAVRQVLCRPERANHAYGAVIDTIARYAGIRPVHSRGEARARLTERMQRLGLSELAGDFERLLDLSAEEDLLARDVPLSPQRLQRLLNRMFQGLVQRRPLLLILEDEHWLDPMSRDLLVALAETLPPRVGVLVTSRHPPRALSVECLVELAPLSRTQARTLLRQHLHRRGAPEDADDRLLDLGDGNPLFLEEIAAHRQGFGGESATPVSLHGLLLERLDGLGQAAALARVASVLGRRFRKDDLAWLAGEDLFAETDWAMLVGSDLFVGDPEFPEGLLFRHALIRETAYASLESEERVFWHGRVLAAFDGPWQRSAPDRLGEMAHHAEKARQWPRAVRTWVMAANRARSRGEYAQAITLLDKARRLLPLCPEARRDGLAFEVETSRGFVLLAYRGYGSEEARAAFERALGLHGRLDTPPDVFPVLWGIWCGGRSACGQGEPVRPAQQLLDEAERTGSDEHLLLANSAMGNNLVWFGRFAEAEACLVRCLELVRDHLPAELISRYGEDSGITARAFLSWTCWFTGREEEAGRHSALNVERAERLGHPHMLCFALTFSAVVSFMSREPEAVRAMATRVHQVADHNDLLLWQAAAMLLQSWADAALDGQFVLKSLEQSVSMCMQAMPAVSGMFHWIVADAARLVGRLDIMKRHIESAREAGLYSGDRAFWPMLHAMDAEYLDAGGDHAGAQAARAAAGALAKAQGNLGYRRFMSSPASVTS
ncbi:MAG: AAA family ATPase [Halothiobacillaceae bacterium]